LTSKQQQAINSKTQLEEHCRAIEDHRKVLRDQAEQNCKDIKILYQEIRNAIDERETQALIEVENLVSQEEELQLSHEMKFRDQIVQICTFERGIASALSGKEDDI
jgi:hypothetical protein